MNKNLMIFTAATIIVGVRLLLDNPQVWIDVGIVFLLALFPARVLWNGMIVAYQIDRSGNKNIRRYYIGVNMMLSVISFWIVFSIRGNVRSPIELIFLTVSLVVFIVGGYFTVLAINYSASKHP